VIRNCACCEGRPCGYHFHEFLLEQGLSKEAAHDLTCYEISEVGRNDLLRQGQRDRDLGRTPYVRR
jgi:hypothetical protein